MPQPHRRAVALVLAVACLAPIACRKKPEAAPAPAPAPSQPAPSSGGTAQPAPTTPPPAAPAGPSAAALAEARATLEGAVYFEYDQDGLTDQARAALDAKLAVLVANADVQVRVTGHADDRGSDEYNLALGQRRAATVKRYFMDRGIADSRLSVVSMGEEQPECTSGEESCWQRNRRATFVITSGNITAAPRR
ncbi:MAG: OmpA family protein [Gemmatimonadetes bacterium]|nr:OmpA family protein [Gemmatimonadota bacterium]